jgi:hypothetical protein
MATLRMSLSQSAGHNTVSREEDAVSGDLGKVLIATNAYH